LASISGVSNAEISRIETGYARPYPRAAAALAAALEIDESTLLDEVVL